MESNPLWLQHMLWLLGQPSVWITLGLWLAVFIGFIKSVRRLWQRQYYARLLSFVLLSAGAVSVYIYLSLNAFRLYQSGEGHLIIALQYGKLCVIFLGTVSLIWIIYDAVKARKMARQTVK